MKKSLVMAMARLLGGLLLLSIVLPWGGLNAATRIKQDNTDSLNLGSSWDTLPTAADVGQWDSTVTGPNATVLGANLSWQGLAITNPGGAVTIGGSNTLTLGAAGLNVGANQNFTYNSTGTLALNGPLAGSTQVLINNNTTKNWSGMGSTTFTGALVLRGGAGASGSFSGNWLAFGNASVTQTGSFALDTGASLTDRGELIVTDGWGDGSLRPKLTLSSLTGFGDFRSDWGANTFRTVLVDQSSNTTFNGRLVSSSGSRGIDLEKDGSGSLLLQGVSNHRNTTVTGGTLSIGVFNAVGTGAVSVNSGATLEFNTVGLFDYKSLVRMRNVSGAGDIVIDGGLKFFNYTGSGIGFAEANSWAGFSGDLIIRGGSEFQTIRNGATATGTGSIVLGDATTSGRLSQIEGNWTWTTPISLVGSANEITNNSAGAPRWNKIESPISGSGNVTFNDATGAMNNGNQGFILAGNNTLNGTLTVDTFVRVGGNNTAANTQAGTLGDLGSAAVVINSGRRLTFSRSDAHTVSNTLSGAGEVHIGSTGITGTDTQELTFTGLFSNTGGVQLNNGRLRIPSAAVFAGGTFTNAGGTLSTIGVSPMTVSSPIFVTGNIGLGNAVDSGTLTLSNVILGGSINSDRTLDVQSDVILPGTISNSSALVGINKTGPGTLTITGSADWTGNTFVSVGTLNLSGGSINNTGIIGVSAGAELVINTSAQVRGAALTIGGIGTVNLSGGALRVNSITMDAGAVFDWGNAVVTHRDAGVGNSGIADRRAIGSSSSTLPVYEGSVLNVTGAGAGLTTSSGSVLDLGFTYQSGAMRYDQIFIDGPLNLASGGDTLNFSFNPLQFRPSEFGNNGAGSLILVVATGGITGTFDNVTGIGNDHVGFTMAPGSPLITSTFNPLVDLDPNTWTLEYDSSTNSILFHYNLSANVPEPSTLGLCALGVLLLRRLRRARQ